MSGHKHATVSAWQRAEHGGYEASIQGWELSVRWRPEAADAPRGFLWEAKGPGDVILRAVDVEEEIELAMAEAEQAAESARNAPVEETDEDEAPH